MTKATIESKSPAEALAKLASCPVCKVPAGCPCALDSTTAPLGTFHTDRLDLYHSYKETMFGFVGCAACGAKRGDPCVYLPTDTSRPGVILVHDVRFDAMYPVDRAQPLGAAKAGAAKTPGDPNEPSEFVAMHLFRTAIRVRVEMFCEHEINSKTLDRLQRFCASMSQVMLDLERPE